MRTQKLGLALRNVSPRSRTAWVVLIDKLMENLETSAEYRHMDVDWGTLDINIDEVIYDDSTLTGVVSETYHYTELRVSITAVDPNAEEDEDD